MHWPKSFSALSDLILTVPNEAEINTALLMQMEKPRLGEAMQPARNVLHSKWTSWDLNPSQSDSGLMP